jgi:hypothetical protein
MKVLRTTLVVALLCAFSFNLSAAPTPEYTPFGFTVDIVGTVHFLDVEHVKKGLQQADGAERVRITRSSQNFTRLEGIFVGTRDHFERDLQGLTQNRFEVKINEKVGGALDVTLTKLESLVP